MLCESDIARLQTSGTDVQSDQDITSEKESERGRNFVNIHMASIHVLTIVLSPSITTKEMVVFRKNTFITQLPL